jgi:hypothetical protein
MIKGTRANGTRLVSTSYIIVNVSRTVRFSYCTLLSNGVSFVPYFSVPSHCSLSDFINLFSPGISINRGVMRKVTCRNRTRFDFGSFELVLTPITSSYYATAMTIFRHYQLLNTVFYRSVIVFLNQAFYKLRTSQNQIDNGLTAMLIKGLCELTARVHTQPYKASIPLFAASH